MMLRPSTVRAAILPSALLCAFLVTACSSTGEKTATNTASANAPAANANQANSNTAVVTGNANSAAAPNASQAKLNLNTATGEQFLAQIPGLGNRMVHEFEEYRPYKSVQQFRREMGKYVKPEQIAEYEKHVYVPISENDSDAPTLQQIPGLDATEAAALVAGRPYASRDVFLAKLAEKISADELAVAKTYLDGK
jgi:DNA uptake protein ComE-like DNA-binding protein